MGKENEKKAASTDKKEKSSSELHNNVMGSIE
jgi:hypothetical protein